MLARVIATLLLASLALAQSSKSKAKAKATTPAKNEPAKTAPVQAGRTLPPPKDESGRDGTLTAFLTRLRDVLRRKDRDALLTMLAEDVEPGIGTLRGPSAFAVAWELSDPNSGIYALIAQIRSMPGVWVADQFCGPYVGIEFPKDLDPSNHQVVLNPNVKLRETPSQSGRVLATLSYNIVEVIERDTWMKVKTESGLTGYMESAYIYSPAAYRMCLAKDSSGMWRIASLKAGV